MAGEELKAALKESSGNIESLEGREFHAEFFDPTDKLGADKPNPKRHVASVEGVPAKLVHDSQ